MNYSKNVLMALFFGTLLVIPVTSTIAGPEINATAVCPPSVTAGTPLQIEVTVVDGQNCTIPWIPCTEFFTFNRFMTSMAAGSRRNTLGMLGVYGPFPYNLPGDVTLDPLDPAGFKTTITIINSVPGNLVGQMVGATASVIDMEGQIKNTAYCVTEVE